MDMAKIILNGEPLESFPLKSKKRPFNIVLLIISNAVRQAIEMRVIYIKEGKTKEVSI